MAKRKKTGSFTLKVKTAPAKRIGNKVASQISLERRGSRVATILDRLVEVQKKFFIAEAKAVTKNTNVLEAIVKVNENGIEISVDKYGYFTAKTESTNNRSLHANRTIKIEALNTTLRNVSQHLHPELDK